METKQCSCCGQVKPVSEFHKDKQKIDGLTSKCKMCRKQDARTFYERKDNKHKIIAHSTQWKKNNPDKDKQHRSKHRIKYKERYQKYEKTRAQNNPGYFAAKTKKRYSAKLKRTPPWLSIEDFKQIEKEYLLAAWCSEVMKEKYHVDHIVPLQGKTVSGLHVPWNLQVIPARDNIRKGNKHDQGEW
jgi:hypothetical protein